MNAKSFFVRLEHFLCIIYSDDWEIFFSLKDSLKDSFLHRCSMLVKYFTETATIGVLQKKKKKLQVSKESTCVEIFSQ